MKDKLAKIDPRDIQQVGPVGVVQTTAGCHVALRVPVPRNLERIELASLYEASRLKGSAYYSWSTRNRDGSRGLVEGASIKLATMLYRNWTNAALEIELVSETKQAFIVKATFIDLESGATFPDLFRQHRKGKKGRMDAQRQDDIDLQIAQSKAARNAICKGLPEWLISAAIDRAKMAEAEGITHADIERMVNSFRSQFGVTVEMIEKRIGGPVNKVTPVMFATLRGVYQAMRDKETTAEDEFTAVTGRSVIESLPPPTEDPCGTDQETGEVKEVISEERIKEIEAVAALTIEPDEFDGRVYAMFEKTIQNLNEDEANELLKGLES